MTGDEILADLNDRIDRAVSALSEMREAEDINHNENLRLFHKIDGLLTVMDWLRSYPTEIAAVVVVMDRPICPRCYSRIEHTDPWGSINGKRYHLGCLEERTRLDVHEGND